MKLTYDANTIPFPQSTFSYSKKRTVGRGQTATMVWRRRRRESMSAEDWGSGVEFPGRRSGEGNPDCGREERGEGVEEARESDACLVAAAVFKTVEGE